jgi:hypothetical protein
MIKVITHLHWIVVEIRVKSYYNIHYKNKMKLQIQRIDINKWLKVLRRIRIVYHLNLIYLFNNHNNCNNKYRLRIVKNK